jgi:hypothetical protein
MPTWTALAVVFGLYLAAMLLSLAYFTRYRMAAPPLGVMNLSDVAVVLACIVLVPYLHVLAPSWASTALLSVVMGSLFYLLVEPLVAGRPWRGLIAGSGVALGLAAAWGLPGGSPVYTAINNVLVVLAVVALGNLWVQSGLSVRNLMVLALAISVYDFVFTGRLPLTAELFVRLEQQPFEPLIAWRDGPVWPAMGLGDTLMAASFVVALLKAWGRGAAMAGLATMALAVPVLYLRPLLGTLFVTDAYPAMVIIGPAQLALYLVCRRHFGAERTLGEYRSGIRTPRPAPPSGWLAQRRLYALAPSTIRNIVEIWRP